MASDINILICIDGTHSNLTTDLSDEDYDTEFKGSHVRRVADTTMFQDNTIYIRGPATLATTINKKYTAALGFITKVAEKNPESKITLHFCGHSRGGAIVLDLANELCSLGSASVLASSSVSGEVDNAFRTAKSNLAGRCEVSTLALFDAVDMAFVTEGKPIRREIGHVAHAFRSSLWGSRNAWGNVGLDLEKGSSRPKFLQEFNCTHAAMGGTPCTGDIPKPMVNRLLGLKSPPLNWELAEMHFAPDSVIQSAAIEKSAMGQPGLFVNPRTGVMMDLVSKIRSENTIGTVGKNAFQAAWTNPKKTMGSKSTNKPGARAKQTKTLLKETMTKYAKDTGTLWHDQYNSTLGGYQGLARCFATQKEASEIVNNYRVCDEVGSRECYKWVTKTLGYRFPAKL